VIKRASGGSGREIYDRGVVDGRSRDRCPNRTPPPVAWQRWMFSVLRD
jgi:hypothetical protein